MGKIFHLSAGLVAVAVAGTSPASSANFEFNLVGSVAQNYSVTNNTSSGSYVGSISLHQVDYPYGVPNYTISTGTTISGSITLDGDIVAPAASEGRAIYFQLGRVIDPHIMQVFFTGQIKFFNDGIEVPIYSGFQYFSHTGSDVGIYGLSYSSVPEMTFDAVSYDFTITSIKDDGYHDVASADVTGFSTGLAYVDWMPADQPGGNDDGGDIGGGEGGVPEPTSWAMFLMGFASTGIALRRRGRQPGLAFQR